MISLLSLTKIAMALDMADELRDIFTSVPYRDIQEVINETRSQSKRRDSLDESLWNYIKEVGVYYELHHNIHRKSF